MLAKKLLGSTAGIPTITFIASAQAQPAGSTPSLVIDKPTGTLEGHLMIAIAGSRGSLTWTPPAGWTEIYDSLGNRPSPMAAYKIAGASEGSNYTFTASGSERVSGAIFTFSNADYDAIGTVSSTIASSVQTAPAVTLSTNNSAILAVFMCEDASRTYSSPTSGLISTAVDDDANNPSWHIYRELNLSSGSTGTRSATCSVNNPGGVAAFLVGIKPA